MIFAGEGLMLGDGAVCEEEVVKVDRKGSCAGEKVFVWFERRYYGGVRDPYGPRDGEGGWERKEPAVVERRSLVFMKRDEEQEQGAGNEEGEKIAEMALNKKKKRVIRGEFFLRSLILPHSSPQPPSSKSPGLHPHVPHYPEPPPPVLCPNLQLPQNPLRHNLLLRY